MKGHRPWGTGDVDRSVVSFQNTVNLVFRPSLADKVPQDFCRRPRKSLRGGPSFDVAAMTGGPSRRLRDQFSRAICNGSRPSSGDGPGVDERRQAPVFCDGQRLHETYGTCGRIFPIPTRCSRSSATTRAWENANAPGVGHGPQHRTIEPPPRLDIAGQSATPQTAELSDPNDPQWPPSPVTRVEVMPDDYGKIKVSGRNRRAPLVTAISPSAGHDPRGRRGGGAFFRALDSLCFLPSPGRTRGPFTAARSCWERRKGGAQNSVSDIDLIPAQRQAPACSAAFLRPSARRRRRRRR